MERKHFISALEAIVTGDVVTMTDLLEDGKVDLVTNVRLDDREPFSLGEKLIAVKEGSFLDFHDLFMEYGAEYTPRSYWAMTSEFVKYGKLKNLKMMLENDLWDVNKPYQPRGSTPLHYLHYTLQRCDQKCKDMFVYLCKKDKDGNRLGEFGVTGNGDGRKEYSSMDLIVGNAKRDQDQYEKYANYFRIHFEPYEITKALHVIPTSAPHPSLMKKVEPLPSSRFKRLSPSRPMPPGIRRLFNM